MTVSVRIDISEGEQQRTHTINIDDEALKDVRYKFNPSGLEDVERLKTLAAAFITEANRVASLNCAAGRACASARTQAQNAVFWAVHGATEGL